MNCVVLSGGASSRMRKDLGVDKAHLAFGGFESLAAFQLERLKPFFKTVFLSTKQAGSWGGQISETQIVEDLQNIEALDIKTLFAPTLGLLSALQKVDGETVSFLPVDAPFVPFELFDTLQSKATGRFDAIVAVSRGKIHPTCAIYSKSATHVLLDAVVQNKHKLTMLLDEMATIFVDFNEDRQQGWFANLNDAKSYEEALCRFGD